MTTIREVIYVQKVVSDPGNDAVFAKLGQQSQQYTKERIKQDETLVRSHQQSREKQERATEQSYAKERKAAQSAAEQAMKAREAEIKARQKQEADYSRWWEGEIKKREREEQRALDTAKRSHERALAQIKAGNAQMKEGLFGSAEALGRLARGFTLMGFAADKDLQKLIEQLAVVQGGFDLVLGGVKLYSSLSSAVEGYRLSVQAATAAESAAAAVRAGSGAAGVAGSAAGVGGAAAAGTSAGIAAPAVAAAAALASVALAGKVVVETFQSIRDNGLRGGSGPGTVSDSIGSGLNSWAEFMRRKGAPAWGVGAFEALSGQQFGETDRRIAEQDKTERMARLRQQANETREREAREREDQRALAAIEPDIQRGIRGREREGFFSGLQNLNRDDALRALRTRRASGDETEKLEEERRIRGEIRNLEKQAAQEKIAAAEKAIQSVRQELSATQEIVRSREQALKSSAERFADLDPLQQRRLLQIKRKADAEGAGSLTRDERIALRGVGTEETAGIASRSAEADLRRSGIDFAKEFGEADTKRTAELREKSARLMAEVKAEVEVKASLELNEEQAQRAFATMFEQAERRLQEIAADAARKEGVITEQRIRQNANQRDNNRGAAFGPRGA